MKERRHLEHQLCACIKYARNMELKLSGVTRSRSEEKYIRNRQTMTNYGSEKLRTSKEDQKDMNRSQ